MLAILGLWLALIGAAAGIPTASPLSLDDYIQQLQQLQKSLQPQLSDSEAGKLADALPAVWAVEAGGQKFEVPTVSVVSHLREYAANSTQWSLEAARRETALLLADAHAMSAGTKIEQDQRARLSAILARREFHKVHGETWIDRLKAAATRLLVNLFGRIISSSAFPVVSRVVVWVLVGLVSVLLLLWLLRTYRQSNIYTNISGSPGVVAERPWRDWQAEAQRASEQGQWRDAVHFYYWAAIAFLEERELWRPDPARTPREYLRLVGSQDERRQPLEQLTFNFERTWYGNDPATEQSARSAKTLVESLGCR